MKSINQYIKESKQSFRIFSEAKHSFRIKSHLKKSQYNFIDLGLPSGTLWTTCNIGATKPEEYGDYFAWGETEPKEEYGWENYKYSEDLTKYNKTDKKDVLDKEDDAAYVNTQGEIRMPTIDELEELLKHTNSEVFELEGVKGRKFVSKKDESKWIFIPFSGFIPGSKINANNKWLYLLSSSVCIFNPYNAYGVGGNSSLVDAHSYDRSSGTCVRGVLNK